MGSCSRLLSGRQLAIVFAGLGVWALSGPAAMASDRVVQEFPNAQGAPTLEAVSAFRGALVGAVVPDTTDDPAADPEKGFLVRFRNGGMEQIGDLNRFAGVDLTRGRVARRAAVYSRCTETRCSIFERSIDTLNENRIRGFHRPGTSPGATQEGLGALKGLVGWHGRYVFTFEHFSGFAAKVGLYTARKRGRLRRITRAETAGADIRGRNVAYVKARRVTSGVDGEGVTSLLGTKVVLHRLGHRRDCLVAIRNARAGEKYSDPVLQGGYVYWVATTDRSLVLRRRLPGRGCKARGKVQVGRAFPHPAANDPSGDLTKVRDLTIDGRRGFYILNGQLLEFTDPPLSFH